MYCAADAQPLPLQALIVALFPLSFITCPRPFLPLAACPTVKAQPCVGPAVEMMVVQVAKVGHCPDRDKNKHRPLLLLLSYQFLPLCTYPRASLHTPGPGWHCHQWLQLRRGRGRICSVPIPPLPSHFSTPLFDTRTMTPVNALVRPDHASCGLAGPTRRRRSRTRPSRPPCRFRLALLG